MKTFHWCTLVTFLLLLNSCLSDVENQSVVFLGDSLVARWDIAKYFPSLNFENKGKSGSHIDYIEQYKKRFVDRDVVIIIGTNDISKIDSCNAASYAKRYVSAVKDLGANRILLFSIFPRNFAGDKKNVNEIIKSLNSLIQFELDSPEIIYLNVFDELLDEGMLNMQYSNDGLHLNSYGYEIIAHKLKSVL